MKKTALDFWVGLFVVLGFVALLFLALKAGNLSSLSFQPTYAVKLKFDNIGGLKARAPVKSAGVMVGRVGSIGFDQNTYPGGRHHRYRQAIRVSEGFVGEDPDLRPARRAVHRHRSRAATTRCSRTATRFP